jgi:hypothetical protein
MFEEWSLPFLALVKSLHTLVQAAAPEPIMQIVYMWE